MDEERTEEPSPRKLRRARERGDVPQSSLLGSALVLLGVTAVLALRGDATIASLRALIEMLWRTQPAPAAALAAAGDAALSALAWPLGAAVILGTLASVVSTGGVWTARPFTPQLAVRRLFSFAELIPRVGSLALAALLFGLGLWVLRAALPGLLGRTDGAFVLGAAGAVLGALLWRAAAILAASGAIAAIYHRLRWVRRLRMTRREQREETRETQGDPTARRRRAELHRERALGPTIEQALDGAALVVTAPALAVVVRWRGSRAASRAKRSEVSRSTGGSGGVSPPEGSTASVSLDARGVLAQRVRSKARAAGIALVHDPTLALDLARAKVLGRASLARLARHLARIS